MSDNDHDLRETARMTGLAPARILEIVENAENAFYEALSKDTGAATGDVSPGPLRSFMLAARSAALAWLRNNVEPKIDAAFVAALPTCNGWRAALDAHSGAVVWRHESGRGATIYATPNYNEPGLIPFDVLDDSGDGSSLSDYLDAPWDATPEGYLVAIRDRLAAHVPPALPIDPATLQSLVERAAHGDKWALFTLRDSMRPRTTEIDHDVAAVKQHMASHGASSSPWTSPPCVYHARPNDPTPRTTIAIRLEIEGDADDAYNVVERVLDEGTLQDAINGHDEGDAGDLHVVSALCETWKP